MEISYIIGLINRHNDKDDNATITNFNMDNGANVHIPATLHVKGEEPIEVDETNSVLIIESNRFDVKKGYGPTYKRYISLDKVTQVVIEE